MTIENEIKILPSATVACLMPMMLGAFVLAIMLQNIAVFQTGRSFSESPYFMSLPIALCFLFGTPLAAITACVRLGNIRNLGNRRLWQRVTQLGVQSATSVHIWSALIYTIIALMFFFPDGGTPEGLAIQWIGVLIISAIINALLWAIITLPCSLFCTTLFWLAVKSSTEKWVFRGAPPPN